VRRLPLALSLGLLLGASPFREEHPLSRQARERIAAGAPDRALESYARLEGETGPRPEIELGRGAALLELSRDREAEEAFGRARAAPEPLGSRALLGLSDARAGAGDLDGAVAAAREALVRDPGYEDARVNLELLLRRRSGEKGEATEGGPPPGPARSPGAGSGEERGGRPPAGDPAPRAGRGGEGAGGSGPAGALSRREAERLLDALRAREANLPASAARPRGARRPDAEKDW
jgi:tetratricopeptide (TPR) repeat protein